MVTLNEELLFKVDFKKPKNSPFQVQKNIYNVRTLCEHFFLIMELKKILHEFVKL